MRKSRSALRTRSTRDCRYDRKRYGKDKLFCVYAGEGTADVFKGTQIHLQQIEEPIGLKEILRSVGIILQIVLKDTLPRIEICNIINQYGSMRVLSPIIERTV